MDDFSNFDIIYGAGVYDFKVEMEVQMTKVGDLLVPALLRYNGNWKAIFKKRGGEFLLQRCLIL